MGRESSAQIAIPRDTPPTRQELARLLRDLRRRHARERGSKPVGYRELAARTGWAVGTVSDYFTGNVLPPTDRFDVLVQLLGAASAEQGVLATFRDLVEEHQHRRQPTVARPTSLVPRQVPVAAAAFTGRKAELAALTELLDLPDRSIVVIAGTAGVGKTALALTWAHQVAERFPDGQLYVNLRGFDPAGSVVAPADAVRRFLDALQVPPTRIPGDLDSQAAMYRSLLAGRRMLVVLDNARDAGQVRPLLPATAGCFTVVTSRNHLTPLVATDGAHPLLLDLLTPAESRAVLARRLGDERVAAEPDAVAAVVAGCARLPLALGIAAARAQTTGFPLAAVAAELAVAHRRLDTLDAGDAYTEVRAVFSWSYATLSPEAARLFRLLGLHPGAEVTAAAVAALTGAPLGAVRRPLAELTAASLVIEHTPGRYGLHDLLRAYATELVTAEETDAGRRAAVLRLVAQHTHTAHAADRLLHPSRYPIPLALGAPVDGADPVPLAGPAEAMAWLTAEHATLLAVLRHAAASGLDEQTWQLTWSMDTYLHRQGHWFELTAAWQVALRAADRLGDPAAQACGHRLLAHAHSRLNRTADAHRHLRRALDLYLQRADQVGQAHTHRSLTILCEQQGDLDQALAHAEQALAGYRAADHRHGQAVALNAVGWYLGLLGNHTEALARCQQALALFVELGDRDGEAHTSDSLGYAYQQLGRYSTAAGCYLRARALFRGLADRYSEARVLIGLGENHEAAGDTAAAVLAWRAALDILVELDHPDAEGVRARLAGAREPRTTGVP